MSESETPNFGDGGHVTHYDALGRLDQLDSVHFTYGANGQITSATNGAQSWKFYYDENGQRIYKTTVNGATETPTAAYLPDGYLDATGLTRTLEVGGIVVGASMPDGTVHPFADDGHHSGHQRRR